jgi:hypothetical protein
MQMNSRFARIAAHCTSLGALVALVALTAVDGWAEERDLNQIDYAMYFMSPVNDAQECEMSVVEGQIMISPLVSNPAMTCPDMFAWKLATDVIRGRFWSDWPDETQNWPPEPYRLCAAAEEPSKVHCCEPGNDANDTSHCPVFPGAAVTIQQAPLVRQLRQSIRSHLFGPHETPGDQKTLMEAFTAPVERSEEEKAKMRPCGELPLPDEPESIGRLIRQTNGELTVRNRSFHDYLFVNNLYNADGVIEVFEKNATNLYTNAPYQRASYASAGDGERSDLSKIAFPPDAIMLKSNWMNVDLMAAIGKKYGLDWMSPSYPYPYIQKQMSQTLTDQQGNKYDCSGVHSLLAFHISSKDIPNWVWATFEHVQLPGRCDFTGCNDSWGYFSSDTDLPAGAARNYVKPKTKDDDLPKGNDSFVFHRDQLYPAETIRPQLDSVLRDLGIGVANESAPEPVPGDKAWLSYRLKGTQVEFVDSMGRPTFLGHSVTEAGFVNGSSCITCHARAGTDADGPFHPGMTGRGVFPLSVFQNDLSDFGYGKSAHGVPNKNWFHQSNQPPSLQVLQTDFVWGFLFARKTVD